MTEHCREPVVAGFVLGLAEETAWTAQEAERLDYDS